MQSSTPRRRELLLLAPFIISAILPTASSADEAKVKQLQKDRLDVLKQIVEDKERAFRNGGIPLSDCASAYQQMFEAELAICADDAERIKVREKMLERAKADEEIVSRLFRAGEARTWDHQAAIARRLAIEIELERLKK
ncbi:MAG TPA: hypothetical protein VGI40_20380 [Pirellulaceae bacterium]